MRLDTATDSPATQLRRALKATERSGPLLAPGAYDALSALLVEQAGFKAVYLTGFGAAASLLGMPDIGLLTATEMTDHARRLSASVNIPVIADADTGYGNPINVRRTVREYERAGVAAIQLEDQVSPKRCGHMSGKSVIPTDEMVNKIRAAADARLNDDMVIIARTDALACEGLDAAVRRGKSFRDAGADLIFVEAPTSRSDVRTIAERLTGIPLMYNWVEGGRSPALTSAELAELGFRLVIFPLATLLAATEGTQRILAEVRRAGTPAAALSGLPEFSHFTDLVGLREIQRMEQDYASS